MLGVGGLNRVPSARMDADQTMRLGVSTAGPYNHAFLGLQIAKPLTVNLRQSMEISSILDEPERVYPGMDIKLRLMEEGRYQPELAFGMNSVLGHQRFSSEYVALSKRFYDWDFTGGIAWGRLAGGGHIRNPLARLSTHFDQDRNYLSEENAHPSDWFTGKEIGFFGGVEYYTPFDGLSLKADFGGDDFTPEKLQGGFDRPAPWSAGFNYSPRPWLSFAGGLIGGDMVMARLSLQHDVTSWPGKADHINDPPVRNVTQDKTTLTGLVEIGDGSSAAQIGAAAKTLEIQAAPEITTITVIPIQGGIKGKAMTFSRRDIRALQKPGRTSPEEIWRGTRFSDVPRALSQTSSPRRFSFNPELGFSLGEDDTSHLYRVSLVAGERKHLGYGLYTGNDIRLNLADRFDQWDKIRPRRDDVTRSNAGDFARNRVTLDRSFLAWMGTILPDTHMALSAGYLEEMFAGVGGEILYRPHQSPFSFGVEGWAASPRDPLTTLALGVFDDRRLSGHLNLFYDIPATDITAFAKAGRYLAGDVGGTLGVQKTLDDGLKIKGFMTATNEADQDIFGESPSLYAGFELSLPLGNLPYVPAGSTVRLSTTPMARDFGQAIDKPVSLFDLTEPMSYRHLGQNWQAVQRKTATTDAPP